MPNGAEGNAGTTGNAGSGTAGAGATGAEGAVNTGSGQAGAGTSGAGTPGAGAPGTTAAFDWKTHFTDPIALKKIEERGWKGPGDLLQSYTNLEKFTGVPAEQIVKIPKGNDPAEWGEAFKKLGRPDTPDGYKLAVPEGDSGDFAKAAAAWFHEAGLSQFAAAKISEKWNEHIQKTIETGTKAAEVEFTGEVNALKTEWGAEYQSRSQLVDRAAKAFGMTTEQLSALRDAMGPKGAMKFLHNIGSKLAVEDAGLIGSAEASSFNSMTPERAQAEINALQKDRTFAEQFNSSDPKVKSEARARMRRLHMIAFPTLDQ